MGDLSQQQTDALMKEIERIAERDKLRPFKIVCSPRDYEMFTGEKIKPYDGPDCPGLFSGIKFQASKFVPDGKALKIYEDVLDFGFQWAIPAFTMTAPMPEPKYKRGVFIAGVDDRPTTSRKLRYLLRTARERGHVSPRLARRIRKERKRLRG